MNQDHLSSVDTLEHAAKARQGELKRAAIHFKNANDRPQALAFLRLARTCDDILEQCSFVREGIIDWADCVAECPPLPPPPPPQVLAELDTAASASSSTPSSSSVVTTSAAQPSGDSIAAMVATLKSQSASCIAASAYYLARGAKADALRFHRYRKEFDLNLAALLALAPTSPAPSFSYQSVTYSCENSCPDLDMNVYAVDIVAARGLGLSKAGVAPGTEIPILVIWEVGFPEATGKGETVAMRSSAPDIDIVQSFQVPIDRKNKAFQRLLERKRATFEVFYQTGGFLGMFSSRVSLGKAMVKLDTLLTKPEIHESLRLVDANRKPIGGTLEVKIRMRQPLLRPDIAERTERWLFLAGVTSPSGEAHLPAVPVAAAAAPAPAVAAAVSVPLAAIEPPKRPPSTSAATSAAHNAGSAQPVVPRPLPTPPTAAAAGTPPPPVAAAAAPSAAAAVAVSASELEAATEWLASPDSLVSCLVLEQELGLVAAGATSEQEDRKQALQLKLQLLQLSVEMGTLSMDKYRDQLQAAISVARKHAGALKRGSNLEGAKKALVWTKLMAQEVQEIEAMLAGAGEDDGAE
ncbi:hypothetical protein BC828DRAFT_405004 [Blastocladiella britannica]|nr:hypothetical protein BC828DRAFT_405004 [Blastocladiella britannica]